MEERLPEEYRLSERKKLILKAIIDAHITYGEPVGSKYLAENQQLSCSSATIRNEMAELEELGFLEQPHTSAGRIPSQLGYRFYVNSLLQQYRMTAGEIEAINSSLKTKLAEMDQLLSEASRIAANATNYTGIAVKNRASAVTIRRFDCVRVDDGQFVLVMMPTGGSTAITRAIRPTLPLPAADLAHLIALFNEHLTLVPAEGFTLSLIGKIERGMGRYSVLVAPIVRTVYEAMTEADRPHTAIEGVNHLLRYPEYADLDKLRSLLDVLEDKEELRNLVPLDDTAGEGVNVFIGSENTVKVMEHSTLVFRNIRRGGRVVGAIGVIGPRRMDYSKVIATIDGIASRIDEMLSDDDSQHLLKG